MRRSAIRILSVIVGTGLAFTIGGCVSLWGFQEAILFPASRDVWRTPADPPFVWTFERLTLPIGDEQTDAWYIPVEDTKGVILFSHGNGGNIADRMEHYAMLRDLGYDILAYDYGGYGKSTGKPSEKRCYQDIRAAWDYLTKTRGIPANRIVLYGESLGGGATCELAKDVQPRAVILQSTFLSVAKRAKEIMPIIPVGLLLKHRFDNDTKIGRITAPILVIHSHEDTIIPYRHGRGLFDLANGPKTFLELQGDHNDCIFTSEEVYREGMRQFLESL
jgi:hypothetical protein